MTTDLRDAPASFAPEGAARAREATRRSVLVVAEEDRTGIVLRGKDRTSWLNGLLTADLAKRGPDEATYALLVEKKGKIRTDLTVIPTRGDDALVLSVPAALRDDVTATLDHYLIMEDVEMTAEDLAIFALHGPEAWAVASKAHAATFAGKLDVLGSGGAVVAATHDRASALREELTGLAAAAGGFVADGATWDAVRIGAGIPRLGVEFDQALYPQEASLEKRAVSFSKGCYLGQEVVYMLENRGHVKKKLVALEVDGEATLSAGDSVTTAAGDAVGDVRSAALAEGGKVAAIAMVKWGHAALGTALRVGERDARVRG